MVRVSSNPNPTNPAYRTNPTNPTNPTTKYHSEFVNLFCIICPQNTAGLVTEHYNYYIVYIAISLTAVDLASLSSIIKVQINSNK